LHVPTDSDKPGVSEWLGAGGKRMEEVAMLAPDLVYSGRRMEYDLACNWKVFNDNYLVRAPDQAARDSWRRAFRAVSCQLAVLAHA
jgi:hypothetical protein